MPAYDADWSVFLASDTAYGLLKPHSALQLTHNAAGWRVELVALPYDWAAAICAEHNGRSDRAAWIRSGRAT